jgi:arylsulfatase A-like enzyme
MGRRTIFGAVFTHDLMDLENPLASLKYRWSVQGRWKLIVPHYDNVPDGRIQLYDVVKDPQETANLAAQEEARTRSLLEEIQSWWPLPD